MVCPLPKAHRADDARTEAWPLRGVKVLGEELKEAGMALREMIGGVAYASRG